MSLLTRRFSALHHAALTGTTELLAALLDAQAAVDVKDSNGEQSGRQSLCRSFRLFPHFPHLHELRMKT